MQDLVILFFGALAGSMLFFAFVVAPTVFRSLPAEHAGPFLRALFPRYYFWGLVFALFCAVAAWSVEAGTAAISASLIILVLFVYARQILMPAINRARDRELEGNAKAGARFRALHLQSVVINGLQLLLLLALCAYLLWR